MKSVKKRLLITSTDLMMIQFLVPHVRYLSENGFEVEIACSEVGGRMEDVREALRDCVAAIHPVRLERSPASPRNLLGYGDMKKIIRPGKYDIVWTNEPVMGVMTRLAAREARKKGTKVVYMVHGFHFFSGASLLNWGLYYPVERVLSHFCDVIVTMNEEDFRRAKNFSAKQVEKISGVGVDTSRFAGTMTSRQKQDKRRELGIPEDAYVILSVGELTKRKNHAVMIRALQELEDPTCHYVLCGRGDLQGFLETLAGELGVKKQVHFLGYRMDIPEIIHMAAFDVYMLYNNLVFLFQTGEKISCLNPYSCTLCTSCNIDLCLWL